MFRYSLKLSLLSTITLLSLGIGGRSAHAAFFQGLDDLPGGIFSSRAYAISADGSTVVGTGSSANSTSGLDEAFIWTQSGGMVGLGFRPSNIDNYSEARGVSGDGSIVVGDGFSQENYEAFIWTQSGGMVGLGDLPGGFFYSTASAISADGSTVVGNSSSSDEGGGEAYLWTQSGGMVGLGDLPGNVFQSYAFAVSADGSTVVGQGTPANSFGEAFIWTQSGGMVGLGNLPGGDGSVALGVSADGSIVVGSSGFEAFIWTQSGGMVGLGDLPGGSFLSGANAISGDGSIVVGASDSSNGVEAFLWDSTNGMRSLQDVLTNNFGLNLTGWHLETSLAISADGKTIVGYGTNPNGETEAWIANLTPTSTSIPEPSNLIALCLVSLFGLAMKKV